MSLQQLKYVKKQISDAAMDKPHYRLIKCKLLVADSTATSFEVATRRNAIFRILQL